MSRAARRGGARYEAVFIRFVAAVAIVGWIYSRRAVVNLFNQLPPIYTLIIWYLAFFAFVYFVFRDLPFMGRRFGAFEALGVTLITFAFLIAWNQVESPWAAIASGENPQQIPNILLATEDGVTWMFWQGLVLRSGLQFPMACILGYCVWPNWYDLVKDLTYVVTPVLLLLAAGLILGLRRAGRYARSVAR
ncbi:MAG: hypothetical protein QW580_01940 [Nitrososphaerota archaeon]